MIETNENWEPLQATKPCACDSKGQCLYHQVKPEKPMNNHKPDCTSNITCAVYHQDGKCPGYKQCDCGLESNQPKENIPTLGGAPMPTTLYSIKYTTDRGNKIVDLKSYQCNNIPELIIKDGENIIAKILLI